MGVTEQEEHKEEILYSSVSNFENEACRDCPTNPANGGSGICHCPLGLANTNK